MSGLAAYEALARLLTVALTDTGQGWRCANFVLAWWNGERDGGFDLADLWNVDQSLADDMVTVFAYVAKSACGVYPTEYRAEIEEVLAVHRVRGRSSRAKRKDAA